MRTLLKEWYNQKKDRALPLNNNISRERMLP